MKSNIVPALIIAVALLGCAFLVQNAIATGGAKNVAGALERLELAGQKKADGSDSQMTVIVKGLSKSLAEGFKQGMNDAMEGSDPRQHARDAEKLAAFDKLVVTEVRSVTGNMKSQERVIGLVKNENTKPVMYAQLTVLFKDADGKLLDLGTAGMNTPLKPGESGAFECTRSLGNFNEAETALNSRRASSYVVKPSSVNLAN